MSPRPDIDALLPDDDARRARREALVAELRPAAASVAAAPDAAVLTRRRLVQAGLVGGGAVAVGLVGTTVVPGLGSSSVDVLGSARAAVAPATGGILHTLVHYEPGPHTSMGHLTGGPLDASIEDQIVGTVTGTTEQWSSEDPAAQHTIRFVSIAGRREPARWETSYGDGIYRERLFWQQDVVHVARLDHEGRAFMDRERRRSARPGLARIGDATDPVTVLRTMLDRSLLRPSGATTLDGRAVRRLVGRDPGHVVPSGRGLPPTDVEVLVDADTFAPVRIVSTYVLAARPHGEEPAARHDRRFRQTWTFERYERLPRNADTAGLLQVDTDGRDVRPFGRDR